MENKENIIYPGKIKEKLNNIFEKIALFYPEKKIFAFDSLCKHQREALVAIATELEVDYNQILSDFGYRVVTRNEALSIRSSVVYTPGNEPEIIKNRFSNMLESLEEYYPEKIIQGSIEKEHKKLSSTISGFAIWLGYKTTADFLNAYGYSYSATDMIGEKKKREALETIDLLKLKYNDSNSKPTSIDDIETENPELVEILNLLKRKSKTWFGVTFANYLMNIGLLEHIKPTKKCKLQEPRFKKDSKTTIVSIKDFYEQTGYLKNYKNRKWKKDTAPDYRCFYYKFTSNLLMIIKYGCTWKNYGTTPAPKLEEIVVAFRDGDTEYKLAKEKLCELKENSLKAKKSKKILEEIEWLEYLNKNVRRILPKFSKPFEFNDGEQLCSESITIVETKISKSSIASKYVVLDLETNGLRTANDDLLSISLYDPSTGKVYNRLLPLELQPTVLTTYINGIDDSDVENANPLCQKEFDDLIKEFDLTNKTILYYSGGKFDFDFLDKYCRRHGIFGIDLLKFENIKSRIASSSYTNGNLSKDNLCNALGIEGVSEIHEGVNDCYLEWQLFEHFVCDRLLIKNNFIYKFSDEYIIPASYLTSYPKLAELANVQIPKLSYQHSLVYEFHLPPKLVKKIRKFPTNINGISIENMINSMLGAKECDNREFLSANNRKLKIVGYLDSEYEEIPVVKNDDGSLKSLDPQYDDYIKAVNETCAIIRSGIVDVIAYIREEIFKNQEIRTQEITFTENNRVLALCDLSSDDVVLEIKTYDIFNSYKTDSVIQQMYYQKGNKQLYAMSIFFDLSFTQKHERRLNDLVFRIYKVEIEKE